MSRLTRHAFTVSNYNLAETLASGQAFRWKQEGASWTGVVGHRWVRLTATAEGLTAEAVEPVGDWSWLKDYLQLEVDLSAILRTFPDDEPMRQAIRFSQGLRLLKQAPWECLASFILSSTKQIVQIQQIVTLLCERYGEPVPTPGECPPAFSFPAPQRLVQVSERELRLCKMGFRAPYLLGTARLVASEQMNLESLRTTPVEKAREALLSLPGVGRKIADCVLLFAYGFHSAFPVDVWVMKGLTELYYPRRRPTLKRLHEFSATHFGPYGGYAQQYLFHFMRTRARAGKKGRT